MQGIDQNLRLELALWLLAEGMRHLVMLTRTSPTSGEAISSTGCRRRPVIHHQENHHGNPIGFEKSVAPIVVPGQLTLRTIRGKNGPFTVGRLATHSVLSLRSKTRSWSSTPKASTGNSSSVHLPGPIRSAAACGSRSVPASTA